MGLSRSRTITLSVSLLTLTSNTLSSILFHQLPDDPYHLASNFGWYLHFANILSVFGFIGALRQHALSIAIFSNYLIIDTVLCSIPRFLILFFLTQASTSFCSPSSSPQQNQLSTPTSASPFGDLLPGSDAGSHIMGGGEYWTFNRNEENNCRNLVVLAQFAAAAGVLAAMGLQLLGALCVRGYARRLWLSEGEEIVGYDEMGEGGDIDGGRYRDGEKEGSEERYVDGEELGEGERGGRERGGREIETVVELGVDEEGELWVRDLESGRGTGRGVGRERGRGGMPVIFEE